MSVGTKLLQAAAGNAGETVYVDDVFSTFLHVGDSSSGRSINNGIDLSGEGGLVWIKGRDSAYNNVLYDTARGATQEMYSNNTDRSAANTNALTAFNSNGFTIGSAGEVNNNSNTYVSWTFRKQEKFFDIVTWTGDGNSSKTISHNLGSTPGMMILKRTNGLPTAGNWIVFHRGINNDRYLMLNSTADHASYGYDWSPTDTTFTAYLLGGADYSGNTNGDTYIAYLFAHNEQDFGEDSDEAIIHCGSYTGNGSTTGPVVALGFEPQWLMIKASSGSTGNWYMYDSMRGLSGSNANDAELYASSSSAEYAGRESINVTSTGFQLATTNTANNANGSTYIYVAIARPHKPASEFAATDLFFVDEADNSDGKEPKFRTTFPVDFSIDNWATQSGSDKHVSSRLTQGKYLKANGTDTELSESAYQFDYMNGFKASSGATSGMYAWMFRRAKGFFDVVVYSGTGSATTFTHNLGVVPELMIAKNRSNTAGNIPWVTYDAANGATKYLRLNAQNGATTYSGIWNDTAPTSSVFSVGSDVYINGSSDAYVIYLFASVAGISKVGSYTGTGSDLNVDCGFSAGARLILIKRIDGNGDWYLYDSVRGIVAGDDPYTLLNSTAVQVTNTDFIDPLSAGFTVTTAAGNSHITGFNTNGGIYIFLAIA